MAGKQHLDIPNAHYYVQLQSNGHRDLFPAHRELESFIAVLTQFNRQTTCDLLGYCLLPKEVHLLINSGTGNALAAGGWLIEQYTQVYNQHYERRGSVFDNQFPCILLDPKQFLLPAIHKIHHLPVSAGLAAAPSIYTWSSHNSYLSLSPPTWLDCDTVLNCISHQRAMRIRRYENFISATQPPLPGGTEGSHTRYRALASEHYIQTLIKARQQSGYSPKPMLAQISTSVCHAYKVTLNDLIYRRRHRQASEARAVIGYLANVISDIDIEQVAAWLCQDVDVLRCEIQALEIHKGPYLHVLQQQFSVLFQQLLSQQPLSQQLLSQQQGSCTTNDEHTRDTFSHNSAALQVWTPPARAQLQFNGSSASGASLQK